MWAAIFSLNLVSLPPKIGPLLCAPWVARGGCRDLGTTGAVAGGTAVYTTVHEGGAYYFASKESKAKFEANSEAYLPQYGGFYAFAIALGKKFDGDPKHADIIDGPLFQFVNSHLSSGC